MCVSSRLNRETLCFVGADHNVHALHGGTGSAFAEIIESCMEHYALVVSCYDDLCAVMSRKLICAYKSVETVDLRCMRTRTILLPP